MADGKWTPGKIFLLVAGTLAGLAIICCGIGYALVGDKVMSGIRFGTDSTDFAAALQKDYGKDVKFGFAVNDRQQFILTIGVSGDLTPERIAEVQEGAWKHVGSTYGRHGFFPVVSVAVGRPNPAGEFGQQNAVLEWSEHTIPVADLVARTGVPEPPLLAFLPDDFKGGNVKITVGGEPVNVEVKTEEAPRDASPGK